MASPILDEDRALMQQLASIARARPRARVGEGRRAREAFRSARVTIAARNYVRESRGFSAAARISLRVAAPFLFA